MRALIRNIDQDRHGRAVVMLVLDDTPDAVRRQLSTSPLNIDAMTRAQLIDQKAPSAPANKPKGGQLCKWLAAREREKPFQQFLQQRYGRNATTPELAEQAVKDLLQFGSRTQLDNDPALNQRFRNEIMLEYNKWLNR